MKLGVIHRLQVFLRLRHTLFGLLLPCRRRATKNKKKRLPPLPAYVKERWGRQCIITFIITM